MRSVRQIGLFLLALVLLPALVYVASRINSLSESEALIEEIYDQQLETILFSVNQHAWDVADGWASLLSSLLAKKQDDEEATRFFVQETPTIQHVFLADTLLHTVRVIAPEASVQEVAAASVGLSQPLVGQLFQRRRVGYRKLEPLAQGADEEGVAIALVFIADTPEPVVVGMVFDAVTFVTNVLTPKLQDVARERFTLGIFNRRTAEPVYATGDLRLAEARQERRLWLFEDYVLGISLSGATVEEVVRGRFYRDLALIGVLAAVLLGGALLVYRNVRREVELARIKSDFVSNVSHELRTPLSLIRMYIETLEMERITSDEQRQRYYRIISQETHRLTRLINNILNFSHIESGRKTYEFAPTDLNGVVHDVLDRYRYTLDQQGFDLAVRLDEALPLVQADGEAVTEALINLIDNAVKYSEEDRGITVTTGRDDDVVYVEVADRGIGIVPAEQDRIFDAFYRSSDHLVHDTKGTGLGLALVRHIMDVHGGSVTVASQPGAGSRFRLLFQPAPARDRTDTPVSAASIP